MKKILLLFIAITSMNCYAQISYEKGYFVNNDNQRIECFIKNFDWKDNPTSFKYKLSETATPEQGTIASVKEFGIHQYSKYIRATVDIDISSNNTNNLDTKRNPTFKKQTVFLEVLIEGEASLYKYAAGNIKKFFFQKGNNTITQLIYKKFLLKYDDLGENKQYKQQLLLNFSCNKKLRSRLNRTSYAKSDLKKYFTEYNTCKNSSVVNYDKKKKKDQFNLTIRPRVYQTSLSINHDFYGGIEFENKLNFSGGIELEYILPFNKNKWSIALEGTYQNYTSNRTITNDHVQGKKLNSEAVYKVVEFPFSLRHHFFLNNKTQIFVNISYIQEIKTDAYIEFTRTDGTLFRRLEMSNNLSYLGYGIGFKYNDKYSMELRFRPDKDLYDNYDTFSKSDYKYFTFIIGYTLF